MTCTRAHIYSRDYFSHSRLCSVIVARNRLIKVFTSRLRHRDHVPRRLQTKHGITKNKPQTPRLGKTSNTCVCVVLVCLIDFCLDSIESRKPFIIYSFHKFVDPDITVAFVSAGGISKAGSKRWSFTRLLNLTRDEDHGCLRAEWQPPQRQSDVIDDTTTGQNDRLYFVYSITEEIGDSSHWTVLYMVSWRFNRFDFGWN